MSDGLTIDVDVQIKDALKKLDAKTVESLLTTALVSGALLIQNAAKQKAPKKTTTLARSIHIGGHTRLAPDFEHGQDYGDLGKPGPLQAIIGTNLEYAMIQEYGGIIHAKNGPYLVFKTKDGTWHSVAAVNIPAHPYMRPALDEQKNAALKEVGVAFMELVAKALAK